MRVRIYKNGIPEGYSVKKAYLGDPGFDIHAVYIDAFRPGTSQKVSIQIEEGVIWELVEQLQKRYPYASTWDALEGRKKKDA